MRVVLLVAHIVGAVALLGPLTSATSAFARAAGEGDLASMTALHRASRAYGTASAAVPAVGFALAARIDAFGDLWVVAAIVLVGLAAAVLFAGHLPAQRRAMAAAASGAAPPGALLARLRASAGVFASTWVVVVWLMVAKPG